MSPVSKVRLSAVALSAGMTFFKPVLNLQISSPILWIAQIEGRRRTIVHVMCTLHLSSYVVTVAVDRVMYRHQTIKQFRSINRPKQFRLFMSLSVFRSLSVFWPKQRCFGQNRGILAKTGKLWPRETSFQLKFIFFHVHQNNENISYEKFILWTLSNNLLASYSAKWLYIQPYGRLTQVKR